MIRRHDRPEHVGSGREPARGRSGLAEPRTGDAPAAVSGPSTVGLPEAAPERRSGRPPVPPPAARGAARPTPAPRPAPPAADAAGEPARPAADVAAEPVDQPPRAPGRAGRDMAAAVSVGAGLGGVVLATLLVWRPSFLLVLVAAVVISIVELSRALRAGGQQSPLTPVLVGAVLMLALAWTRGASGLVVGFLLTVVAVLVWRLADGPVGYLRDASAAVLVALYVPLLAGFAALLLVPDDGVARVLAFIVTVVCSDVGGFAAGVRFGKRPLAPSVSPKKSWEGLAGSVAACVLVGVLLMILTFHGPWWGGVLFGVAIALTATLGDLGESLIKRDLGIKDMGNLLPGHGGLMDRMDSLLPSAAVAWLILSVVAPV
ncbi:phosphatidate cytidylyltransferase [Modestobacter marinus]|uniref:phosphatidate cytidylyltransferase n=1 Tax=Modestobacter marinus TaxID=477641 RepID=UPI001C97A9E1|nr:phosphatidate cytidylyltransferase [Modestobacter marinus]